MINIIRCFRTDKAIGGHLYLNGKYICDTLENADKLIPCGMYNVEVNNSPKFKRDLPLIFNINNPASRGLRLHAGNYPEDSAGCVLVGKLGHNYKSLLSGSAEIEKVITYICRDETSIFINESSKGYNK